MKYTSSPLHTKRVLIWLLDTQLQIGAASVGRKCKSLYQNAFWHKENATYLIAPIININYRPLLLAYEKRLRIFYLQICAK